MNTDSDSLIGLLIVDDDSATRNGIVNHIDWQSLGVDIIQTAEHGEQALSICRLFKPDIVISDIRMREITGVEMCAEIRKMYPECQIIFISGYSDKEYLKAAIHLEAIDYVEKPLNTVELSKTVLLAVRRIKDLRQREQINKKYTQSLELMRHSIITEAIGRNFFGTTNADISELFSRVYGCYRVCILRSSQQILDFKKIYDHLVTMRNDNAKIFENCDVCLDFNSNRNIVILFTGSRAALEDNSTLFCWVRDMVRYINIDGLTGYLAVGSIADDSSKISDSYECAEKAISGLFFENFGSMVYYTDEKRISPETDEKVILEFIRALKNIDEKKVNGILDELYEYFSENKLFDQDEIKRFYTSLAYNIFIESERIQINMLSGKESSWRLVEQLDTLNQINSNIRVRTAAFIKGVKDNENNSNVIFRVEQLVQQRCSDSALSVKDLSDAVYLTPTYLSSLYKKKTGKTLGQYITECRVERAKLLLSDNKLKLYNISSMVGYDDSNYFTKLFKKYVGVTPSEYRERMSQ